VIELENQIHQISFILRVLNALLVCFFMAVRIFILLDRQEDIRRKRRGLFSGTSPQYRPYLLTWYPFTLNLVCRWQTVVFLIISRQWNKRIPSFVVTLKRCMIDIGFCVAENLLKLNNYKTRQSCDWPTNGWVVVWELWPPPTPNGIYHQHPDK